MKILGYDYKIVCDKDTANIDAFGRYHVKEQKIQIANDLHEQQLVSSLLHEVIEAINYHNELKLEHNTIMTLEASLYQVLVDNGVDLSPLLKEIVRDGTG